MPELRTNGSYDPYLAELYSPLGAGAGFSPGLMAGQIPTGFQNPWATPLAAGQPQVHHHQTLQAIQIALALAQRQIAQAIQQAQALQHLHQLVHSLVAQQAASAFQPGYGGVIGAGPFVVQPQATPYGMGVIPAVSPYRYGLTA